MPDAGMTRTEEDFFSADAPVEFGRARAPRLDWLRGGVLEEVVDPELPIIDAHHHLWDRPGNRYLLDELLEDLGSGHRIEATVAIEAEAMYRADGPEELRPVGELEFLNGIAAMSASGGYGPTRVGAAIIPHAELSLGSGIERVLDVMLAASSRVPGVRCFVGWDEDTTIGTPAVTRPGMLREEPTLAAARAIARRGLSLEVAVFFTQLDDVAHLAREVPELTVVLTHLGMPLGYASYAGREEEVRATWRRGMAELSRLPNVVVKLGGLVVRFAAYDYPRAPRPATSTELAGLWSAYVTETVELFGADRCLFESNFPVDKQGVTYRTLWNAFKLMTQGASESERSLLFSGSARRLYRLGDAA